MATIKIKDFSANPGARYYADGKYSGQEYFDKVLKDAYQHAVAAKEKLIIILDGTNGFASSFLSEAFGLLSENFSSKDVLKNIELISEEEPDWKEIILSNYIPNAQDRKRNRLAS